MNLSTGPAKQSNLNARQAPTSGARLAARLDHLPWGKFHVVVVAALSLGWALDSYETTIIGSVLGQITNVWKLSATQGSALVSSWVLGIFVGAVVFGHYSDRMGRKKMFVLTLVWYAAFSLITAFAWSFPVLLACRFLAALGVGGEYSAVTAAMVEFIPQRHRGKASALILAAASIGSIVSSLFAAYFLTHFSADVGWRLGFGVGAVLAVAGVWMRYAIPESPRWLVAHGRNAEADKIIRAVEESLAPTPLPMPPVVPEPQPAAAPPNEPAPEPHTAGSGVKELLSRYLGRLSLACSLNFAQASVLYGMLAALSLIILPTVKVAPERMPFFYFVGNVAALGGGLLAALLIDTLGRKGTVLLGYVMTTFGVLYLCFASTPLTVSLGYSTVMFSVVWATNAAYVLSSEILPVRNRATGLGLSVAVGRIGAFGAPLLLSQIFEHTHRPALALVALAVMTLPGPIAALIWCFKGTEGSNRSLEEISLESAKVPACGDYPETPSAIAP
jgi:MFS family permease